MHVPDLVILLDDEYGSSLSALAEQLAIPAIHSDELASLNLPYALKMRDGALCIQELGVKTGPVSVDFLGGGTTYRRDRGGGELIVKAMGGRKQLRPRILDLTAGLGRDSFVLASWDFKVQMIERSPVVAALLRDGMDRGLREGDSDLQAVISRMSLWQGEAQGYLSAIQETDRPDVIYLDPMFPPSKKSALVKKEMRAFHYIVGEDLTGDDVLSLAREKALYRVVVKRPKKAEYLGGQKPNFSLAGKTIRFDVYSLKAFPK